MSVVRRETTLFISDSTGEPVSIKSEIVRVVSPSTTEIPKIIRLKIRSSGSFQTRVGRPGLTYFANYKIQ